MDGLFFSQVKGVSKIGKIAAVVLVPEASKKLNFARHTYLAVAELFETIFNGGGFLDKPL